ncbi:sporulation protein YabP [Bacillus sp. JJ664]|uniref:Sporulation protein YabP n=1 Tax=Gottfriedia solisilvae TaxID=1516104 RepID=A0A8J3APN5_9BACI|nr:sporulation protein YabP [Gottfriedia solisilvae]GGI18403.1 sporulation protein YabP [Gottfriedia solisilvae]
MNNNPYELNAKNTNQLIEQDLSLKSRRYLEITGVKQVESFDSEEFLLETTLGFLHIKGHNLQMKNLDVEKGHVAIKGKINELCYIDEYNSGKAKGIFSKLFK